MFNLNRFVTVDLKVTQLVGCDLFFGSFKSSYESRMSFFLLGRRFCMDIFNLIYSYVNTKKFINLVTGLLTKRALVWVVNNNFFLFDSNPFFRSLKNRFDIKSIKFFHKKFYGGGFTNHKFTMVASTSFFPHAVFFPNLTNNNYIAREAFSIRVPSVGLVDSFENPNELFLPIPGNSKSIKPVYFFYLLLVVSVYRAKLISAGGFLFKVRDRVWDCYKHIDFIQMFRRGGERFRYNRKYKKLFWYQLWKERIWLDFNSVGGLSCFLEGCLFKNLTFNVFFFKTLKASILNNFYKKQRRFPQRQHNIFSDLIKFLIKSENILL